MTKIIHNIASHIPLINLEAKGRTRPGKVNYRRSPKSDYDCNRMGVKGEVSVATYLGVSLEDTNILGRTIDPGWDLMWCGRKVDAKYISYTGRNREMMITPNQIKGLSRADALVLVGEQSKDSEVEIIGWMFVERFLEIKRLRTYRVDPQSYVSEHDMEPISEMENWARPTLF